MEMYFNTLIGMAEVRNVVWQVCQELLAFIFVKLSHQGVLYLLLNLLTQLCVCPWLRSADSFHTITVLFCSFSPCFNTGVLHVILCAVMMQQDK